MRNWDRSWTLKGNHSKPERSIRSRCRKTPPPQNHTTTWGGSSQRPDRPKKPERSSLRHSSGVQTTLLHIIISANFWNNKDIETKRSASWKSHYKSGLITEQLMAIAPSSWRGWAGGKRLSRNSKPL